MASPSYSFGVLGLILIILLSALDFFFSGILTIKTSDLLPMLRDPLGMTFVFLFVFKVLFRAWVLLDPSFTTINRQRRQILNYYVGTCILATIAFLLNFRLKSNCPLDIYVFWCLVVAMTILSALTWFEARIYAAEEGCLKSWKPWTVKEEADLETGAYKNQISAYVPDESRLNPFNIQVLSSSLQSKVFPNRPSNVSLSRLQLQTIDLARQHLNLHSIPWDSSKRPTLPEINGDFVPPLLAENVEEHFKVMAEELSAPYLKMAQETASLDWNSLVLPQESDFTSFFSAKVSPHGWYHFCAVRKEFISCPDGPADEVVIFDVETAPGVPEFSKWPILACALSKQGLYLWLSPQLGNEKESTENADPTIATTTTNTTTSPSSSSSTTLALSNLIPLSKPLLVIGHHVSFDRTRILEQYSLDRTPQRFLDTLSMHCAVAGISSQQRGLWKEQKKNDLADEEDESLDDDAYDADDSHTVTTTAGPKWCKAGSLNNLKDALKLHCNLDLDKSTRSSVLLSATRSEEIISQLARIAHYCAGDVLTTGRLFGALLPKFLKKSPNPVTFAALLEMSTFIVPIHSSESWQQYMNKCDGLLQEATSLLQSQLESLVESVLSQYPPGSPDPIDDPWLSQLDWQRKDTLRWTKAKFLKDGKTYAKGGEPVAIGNAQLHQKPAWYRKLWKAGGIKVTPRTAIVPLFLKLRWKGQPVALIPDHGWCYELAEASSVEDEIKWNGKNYAKIPHPGGRDDNVGCLLTKNFFKFFESKQLWSHEQEELIKQILAVNSSFSFWIGYRERIREQLVIEGTDGNAFIVPGVMPMGTVTRRAVEKTWLTAANAKEGIVGSELKTLVRAPPGWSLVGADVDSQELWIGALLGDAQFGWSGATALGWMALQGSRSDASDLHSRTASILGMSRDQAKIFNYGRIYGAGVKYAAQLLLRFNPSLSAEEATQKAQTLYHQTKGRRMASRQDAFVSYAGGTESFMFNQMEAIARQPTAQTPVLKAQLSDGLSAVNVESEFLTSRVNWVVQSSGVDYLHLILVAVAYLMRTWKIPGRVSLCIHDELRFLVPFEHRLRAALALQIANLWTRAAFVEAVGVADLPLSVAFFSAVDVDWVLRKEVNMSCKTPSQPEALKPGEYYDIYRLLQECPSLACDGDDIINPNWPKKQKRLDGNIRSSEKKGNEAEYLSLLKKQIFGKSFKADDSKSADTNNRAVSTSPPNVQEHFKKWQELINQKRRDKTDK